MAAASKNTKRVMRAIGAFLQIVTNVLFYALVFLALMRLSAAAYDIAYGVFGDVTSQKEPGRDVSVTIEKGDSTLEIAKKLEEERVVPNRYSFFIRAKITISRKHPIVPGEYELNTSMPFETILEVITNTEAKEDGARQ